MGYLLDNIFQQETILIPEVNILTMATTGVKIVDVSNNNVKVIISFSIQTINSTVDYLGYNNIFISNFSSGSGGGVYAYSDWTTDLLSSNYVADLTVNSFDYANNKRGCRYKYGSDLFLRFTTNPSAGNGDFLCTMIYKQFTSI